MATQLTSECIIDIYNILGDIIAATGIQPASIYFERDDSAESVENKDTFRIGVQRDTETFPSGSLLRYNMTFILANHQDILGSDLRESVENVKRLKNK